MKIYTRTGDAGTTGIFGGKRVEKDDIRIEANGTLDELNTEIGIVRSLLQSDHEWQALLETIQRNLMVVMSHVATPSEIRHTNPNELPTDLASFCEDEIDRLSSQLTDHGYFILPGGTPVSAHLQMARVIARRAERRLCTLTKEDEVPGVILQFINRLSDLFFTMARYEMFSQGNVEERWQSFLYKRKRKS